MGRAQTNFHDVSISIWRKSGFDQSQRRIVFCCVWVYKLSFIM